MAVLQRPGLAPQKVAPAALRDSPSRAPLRSWLDGCPKPGSSGTACLPRLTPPRAPDCSALYQVPKTDTLDGGYHWAHQCAPLVLPPGGTPIPRVAAPCPLCYTSWLLLESQLDQVKENKSPRRHWGGCAVPPPPACPGLCAAPAQRRWWQKRLDSHSGHQPGEAQVHQGTSAAQRSEVSKTLPDSPHLCAPETSL